MGKKKKDDHKSFYSFTPSEYFYERGVLGNKTADKKNVKESKPDWFNNLYALERSFYGVENIEPLRQEYRKNLNKIASKDIDGILEECNMAKRILEAGVRDLQNFKDNTMRTPSMIMSFASMLMSLITFSGLAFAVESTALYAIFALLSISIIINLFLKFSKSDSKVYEFFQQSIRCFEVFQSVIAEKKNA